MVRYWPLKPRLHHGRHRTNGRLRAFSDWGWGVKLLLVRAAPVGHLLLSAVGAVAAASWGPEGRRPNLCGDLRGDRLSAPGSYRDHLTHRSHGNDLAPPMLRAETDLLQAATAASS